MKLNQIKELGESIRQNISKVIVGKDDLIDLVIISMFCSGHVLLEDVPGVGKTVLAKCLARTINCDFKRIQFTPDLLPSDLTGINFFNQKECEFIFKKGPLFSNIILADEINRATPRTQSSLLECMEEGQVTVDGETKVLTRPFFVIATQNPVETQGTFPLPEAQLDRFFMRLKMGYPSAREGREILERFKVKSPLHSIECTVDAAQITDAQESFSAVDISDEVMDYIVEITEATRKHEKISLGVSPRGSLALMRASQAMAIMKGRDFVTPDDIKAVAVPVLSHRIIIKGFAVSNRPVAAEDMILSILRSIPVPKEDNGQ